LRRSWKLREVHTVQAALQISDYLDNLILIRSGRSQRTMANYEALKASLDKNGEVMIRLDTGEKLELHKHNVKFDDSTKEIVVDSGTETYWIGADRVSYYWLHKEAFEKE
jgi:hypothetical protein